MHNKNRKKTYTYIIITLILSLTQSCNISGQQLSNRTLAWKGGELIPSSVLKENAPDTFFTQDTITDLLFAQMKMGKTWKNETPDSLRKQLRYLRIIHYNGDGQPQMGEMIVNQHIAEKVLRIFWLLYEAHYRIERMLLMDEYLANDELAMRANNTSCFNFRFKSNSTTEISKHGAGLAIDINPLYNPYVKALNVDDTILSEFDYEQYNENIIYDFEPKTGEPYTFNRNTRNDIPYKIDHQDLAYQLFIAEGFEWGGDWNTRKDYQHFEYIPQ